MKNTKIFKKGMKIKIMKECDWVYNQNPIINPEYNEGTVISSRWDNTYNEEVVKVQMDYGSEYGFLVQKGIVQGPSNRVIII